ncbi:Uncharacterised protein [uncultured Aggregatibacter sp.]|jgi:haemophilus-specific protein, uncharacterized|nr:hypothetical protein [uncultured Aggregatibacter sp.]VTX59903.1 Uncharacterised protein [uncultured Aggregatibacter sp.]
MEHTMASIRFDKLRFVKKLKENGQTEEQAEALAEALDEALEQSQHPLLTKSEFKIEIAQLESRLVNELHTTLYKTAGFLLAGMGMLMGLFKFFN